MTDSFPEHASYYIYLATLLVSLLSSLTSFIIVILFCRYSAYKNPSRLLQIIISLIFADGTVACCVLIWEGMNRLMGSATLDTACAVMLPVPIMFFIAGYGFTVLVCLRFLQISRQKSSPPVKFKDTPTSSPQAFESPSSASTPYTPPLRAVWATALGLTLPIIVLNSGVFGADFAISRVIPINSSSSITYCMFDPTTWISRVVNFICFQIPLLLTIIINISAFLKGMQALQYSPQSVIAREMKRVGQYLFVLLIIWVPNLITNLMQWLSVRKHDMSFKGESANEEDDDELHVTGFYSVLVGVMILLTSLQGLLNATVYALSHRSFNQFISSGLAKWCSFCCATRTAGRTSSQSGRPCCSSSSFFLCACCCCCASLVEEDYFSPTRASEPLLLSFDEDEEPFTQNGYKCKVTYSMGEDVDGGGVSSYTAPTLPQTANMSRAPHAVPLGEPRDRGDSRSASNSTTQSASLQHLSYPFSPNSSIDATYDRYSRDSMADSQQLVSLSRDALSDRKNENNPFHRDAHYIVGSNTTATTSSLYSSPSDTALSPPHGMERGPSLHQHREEGVSGAPGSSVSSSLSSSLKSNSSLRSSLKLKGGFHGSLGGVSRSCSRDVSDSGGRERALSDSEKVVRFDLDNV